MSQDERTTQPVTDLSEESAAGKVQGVVDDAGATGAIEDHNKSGSCAGDEAITTPTDEKEAEKAQNVWQEGEEPSVMQDAREVVSEFWRVSEMGRMITLIADQFSANFKNAAVRLPMSVYARPGQKPPENPAQLRQEKAKQLVNGVQKAGAEMLKGFTKVIANTLIGLNRVAADQQNLSAYRATVESIFQKPEKPVPVQETIVRTQAPPIELSEDLARRFHEAFTNPETTKPWGIVQKPAAGTSSVLQEAAAEHVTEERTEDGSLSYPPNTASSTLATSTPTIEPHTEYKSSDDSPVTELLEQGTTAFSQLQLEPGDSDAPPEESK